MSWYVQNSTGFSNIIGPLDAAPGGMYDVQDDLYAPSIGKIINKGHFLGIKWWPTYAGYVNLTDTTHNMCFIPSINTI
jgi:hypothetical protein